MRGLDDTDEEIIQLLLEDSRLPYSEIAERVGLSAPAVADRIDRLQEVGLIRRFTVDLDRSLLREGTHLLLTVEANPGAATSLAETLGGHRATEHVFRTVDETIVCTLIADDAALETLRGELETAAVERYDIQLLDGSDWEPAIEDAQFAPDCVECGNTVTSEGERERLDGELYHFCCDSCLASFRDRYERLEEGA